MSGVDAVPSVNRPAGTIERDRCSAHPTYDPSAGKTALPAPTSTDNTDYCIAHFPLACSRTIGFSSGSFCW